jgi:HK97 family phage major capsid protein
MPLDLAELAAALERNNTATAEQIETIRTLANNANGRLRDIEQALARIIGSGGSGSGHLGAPESPLRAVIEAPEFVSFRDRRSDRASVPMSARSILSLERRATITSDVGGDDVSPRISPAQRGGIAFGPQRTTFIHNLMPNLPATSGSIEYLRETTFDNAAAPQSAEGAAKAESSLAFTLMNAPIPTIAHWTKVSRQALSDSAALQQHLDTRLIYGLLVKLEFQVIAGDGTAGGMTGLTHAGNFTPYAGVGGDTAIDSIRRAIGQLEAISFVPDIVILNPDDWTDIDLLKDSQERYLVGTPKAATTMNLWNRLVYPTPAMTGGKFIVASLAQATTFYSREDANLLLSPSDSDNFTKNLVTALAELRALATVNVPAGVIYGDLGELS